MHSLNCCPMRSALWQSRTPWSFALTTRIVSGLRRRGLQEGAVTIRDLVRHALRHRPDHIVVGEVRGGEAADLLQALNTGHGGSLTTVHANNAESGVVADRKLRHAGRRGRFPGKSPVEAWWTASPW